MLYGEAINEILNRLKVENRTDSTIRALIGLKINLVYREICNNSLVDWKPLIRNGNILTVPNYTTGTVSITKYDGTNRLLASTVTGSGTTWTSKMVGRYFKHANSSQWYKIIKVNSTTEIILDQPIVEDSASGLTHTIWKRFYYFPSDVERVLEFGKWNGDGILEETGIKYLRDRTSDISSVGTPIEYSMNGMYEFEDSYSTGTATLTADSNVMTGSGTLWMDNVEAGDLVSVGDYFYHVKRVESDTRIILVNFAKESASDSSYSIKPYYKIGFQLYYNPNGQFILPYTYTKRVFNLVNEDYDRFETPERFDLAILDGAEFMRLKDLDDSKWQSAYSSYTNRITDLKRTDFYSKPKFRIFRPCIYSRGGY